jgi:hypothetical protein
VATARGTFDVSGGVLSSVETGVSIVIPRGAIPPGVQQEIYFKVGESKKINVVNRLSKFIVFKIIDSLFYYSKGLSMGKWLKLRARDNFCRLYFYSR